MHRRKLVSDFITITTAAAITAQIGQNLFAQQEETPQTTTPTQDGATTPAAAKEKKPAIVLFCDPSIESHKEMIAALETFKSNWTEGTTHILDVNEVEKYKDTSGTKKAMQTHYSGQPVLIALDAQKKPNIIGKHQGPKPPQAPLELWFTAKQNMALYDAKTNKPIVLDFYADWCPPCRELMPQIDELATNWTEGDVIKVNVDAIEAGAYKDHPIEKIHKDSVTTIPSIHLLDKDRKPQSAVKFTKIKPWIDSYYPNRTPNEPLPLNKSQLDYNR